MNYPILRLNPRADYRIRYGHLWVYSNEIDNKFLALKSLQPGDLAMLAGAQGAPLGLAYVNPNTLICARILDPNPDTIIDHDFFSQRIMSALKLREQIFGSNCYRLIYGESDFLPGLVVDRFGTTLVVQISTAGMERFLDLIVQALDQIINPETIVIKNDGKMRALEGLDTYIEVRKGQKPQDLHLIENGIKFVAPLSGQKTGWYYDHRMARARLQHYVKGKRVLDLFSYVGGWGISAGFFGAQEVVCSDISDAALAYVLQNAKLNDLHNISTVSGDAFSVMQTLLEAGEKFDVVILDPPSFIPRRKDIPKGVAAYAKANVLALKLINKGGILVSGSCSMHVSATEFAAIIHKAGVKAQRQLRFLEQHYQGPDHPVHPAIPETRYLKSFIVAVD